MFSNKMKWRGSNYMNQTNVHVDSLSRPLHLTLVSTAFRGGKAKGLSRLSGLVTYYLALTVPSFIPLLTMTNCSPSKCWALTVLGTEETAMNKTNKNLCPPEVYTHPVLGKIISLQWKHRKWNHEWILKSL